MQVVFKTGTVLLENYLENDKDDCMTARLHFLLHKLEFLRYEVKEEVMLVFSWLDFMNVIELASQLNCDVRIQFSSTGKPIIVNIDTGSNYSIQIIQLTMTDVTIGRKQNQGSKIVAYQESTNDFNKEKEVANVGNISQTVNQKSQNNAKASSLPVRHTATKRQNDGITENDMDNMIAAAATTSVLQKRPRVDASVPLSQQLQNEMDIVLQDLANFDNMEVDHEMEIQHKTFNRGNELIFEQEEASSDEELESNNKKMKMGRFNPKPSCCINSDMIEILHGTDTEDY